MEQVCFCFTESKGRLQHPRPNKKKNYRGMFGGVGPLVRLRCPLTVRLTSRLWEVIDWVVRGPPRTLSGALRVRGHLLCKSASFCTVATPGEQCHVAPPHTHPLLSPIPPPSGLHPGKMGEASIKPLFLSFASILSIF